MSQVKIIKAPMDPICPRVSVGGKLGMGFYCVYRGELDKNIVTLEAALEALKQLKASGKEPAVNHNYRELGAS